MWKTSKEEATLCSLVKEVTVFIEPIPRNKIQMLVDAYPHQEWLAYLTGKPTEKGNILVEDILVPPHAEVSGGSATAEPFNKPAGCVGIIHSHHSMGAFHSYTDQSFVDRNFPVSITVAKGRDGLQYDAVNCSNTPCGKSIVNKCTVKFVQPQPLFDRETFLKEAKVEIEKGKKVYVKPCKDYQGNFGNYTGYELGTELIPEKSGFEEKLRSMLPEFYGL